MPYGMEDLYVGHAQVREGRRSWKLHRDPEATILVEVKGPDGGWIGITQDHSSRYTPFHVTYRETRHKTRVQTLRVEIDGDRDDAMFKTFDEAKVVFDQQKTKYVCPYGRYVKENRDVQRSKLYRAERAIRMLAGPRAETILSHPDMVKLIDEMMQFAPEGTVVPTVVYNKKVHGGFIRWNHIHLSPKSASHYFGLHEFAHHLTHVYFGRNTQGHGKEFVGVLGFLCNRMYGISLLDFHTIMNQHSVEMLMMTELRKQDVQA